MTAASVTLAISAASPASVNARAADASELRIRSMLRPRARSASAPA